MFCTQTFRRNQCDFLVQQIVVNADARDLHYLFCNALDVVISHPIIPINYVGHSFCCEDMLRNILRFNQSTNLKDNTLAKPVVNLFLFLIIQTELYFAERYYFSYPSNNWGSMSQESNGRFVKDLTSTSDQDNSYLVCDQTDVPDVGECLRYVKDQLTTDSAQNSTKTVSKNL